MQVDVAAQRRVPRTARGRAMRDALLRAAEEVFLEQGYQAASVAAICKRAAVANGSYYQYFPDKQAAFSELWQGLRDQLEQDLEAAAARGFQLKGRVEAVAAALFDRLVERRSLLQVHREAEFQASLGTDSLQALLQRRLPAWLGLPQAQAEGLAALFLGALDFNAAGQALWGLEHHPLPTIVEFLLHGAAPGSADPSLWRAVSAGATALPVPARADGRADTTRRRLLDAAEDLFGAQGYHEASVARVTELAGVGQGTFYLHFPSKADLLAELLRRTNRRLRAATARAVEGLPHRLSQEVAALRSFLGVIARHRAMYRVVREAEFVQRSLGRDYYLDLAEGYRLSLSLAMTAGEVRLMDPLALGLCLMGVGHHLGLRWLVQRGEAVPEPVLRSTIELIMSGILGVVGESH